MRLLLASVLAVGAAAGAFAPASAVTSQACSTTVIGHATVADVGGSSDVAGALAVVATSLGPLGGRVDLASDVPQVVDGAARLELGGGDWIEVRRQADGRFVATEWSVCVDDVVPVETPAVDPGRVEDRIGVVVP